VNTSSEARLIQFLQEELAIPESAIAMAQRSPNLTPNLLPIILWQYGLVTLDELNRILDWLETA
jgi:hypothetical protein